ncbi:MAG: two-component sensor histidine kinase [Bauldia sp.]|nr:MAG: two-component sensor histidine kinase [Bauldia sp.]MBE0691809.1 two-component sensor histidine kinase [Aquamicrobium sp.]
MLSHTMAKPEEESMREAMAHYDDTAVDMLSARDLAAAVPDPIVVFDSRGTVRYANEAAVAAFGRIPQGTVLAHRFRTPDMQRLVNTLLREGRAGAIDYAERVPIERAFRISAMPVGAGLGLFMVHFKDQSETRRIDRMRADFIANASHELRTPLASISGFIETLRGPARNDEKARDSFLQIMQTQTARMARLIDDLLTLSRIEMKPHLPSRENIDLGETVAGVIDSLRHLAAEYGVVVAFERPPQPVLVSGNRDELIQVFVNLLENACKYGQSGGRVDVSVAPAEGGPAPEIAVTFRDYGPGIAEEHIPRITERFYRIDAEKSRVKNGTGLGLAIVKHILTRHEGRLVVRSKPGEGASFVVYLPAA